MKSTKASTVSERIGAQLSALSLANLVFRSARPGRRHRRVVFAKAVFSAPYTRHLLVPTRKAN